MPSLLADDEPSVGGLLGLQRPDTGLGDALAGTYQAVSDAMDRNRPRGGLLDQGAPSWADAYDYNAPIVGQYLSERANALATPEFYKDAAQQYIQAMLMGSTAPGGGFRAFHGSPHDFNAFDLSKIGTGEGAQAYGHGLYFADREGVARSYRDNLSPTYPVVKPEYGLSPSTTEWANNLFKSGQHTADDIIQLAQRAQIRGADTPEFANAVRAAETFAKPSGHMYEVNIGADPSHFLDWDKPLSEQSQHVQDALEKTGIKFEGKDPTGSQLWLDAVSHHGLLREGASAPASETLRAAGIPGIRYLDQGSRVSPRDLADIQSSIADRQQQIASIQREIDANRNNPGLLPPFFASREAAIKQHNDFIAMQQARAANMLNDQTRNTVVFSPEIIDILRKYGIAGLMAGGAAGLGSQQQ